LLYGIAPDAVWLSTLSGMVKLQPSEGDVRPFEGPGMEPSITLDGSVVASARWKRYRPRKVAIATYSVADQRWTEYAEGDFRAGVAISADGAKLAYLGEIEKTSCGGWVYRVHVIDRKTLEERIGPCLQPNPLLVGFRESLSLSPKGDRVAYGDRPIEVWDMDRDVHWKIADGSLPAWSPDGEWIAYVNYSPDQRHTYLEIVHPNGTGAKTLVTLPFHEALFGAPVWSPDSKTLLLNWAREGGPLNIRQLDLRTLKLKTLFRDVWAVGGWAEDRSGEPR